MRMCGAGMPRCGCKRPRDDLNGMLKTCMAVLNVMSQQNRAPLRLSEPACAIWAVHHIHYQKHEGRIYQWIHAPHRPSQLMATQSPRLYTLGSKLTMTCYYLTNADGMPFALQTLLF